MKKPKITKDTQAKIREVLQKIRRGWQRDEIVEYMVGKYQISESYANGLYYKSFKIIEEKEPFDDLVNKTKDEAITRATSLYKEALNQNDLRTATKCLEIINKLNGLYTEKHELKQEVTTWSYEYGNSEENNEQ